VANRFLKRLIDFLGASVGLVLLSPVLVPVMVLVWRQDGHSPFYIAPRVGKGGILFKMVKLRSMVKNADKTGLSSTSSTDQRITKVGHFIRRFKLDELTQLWNVLVGDMSLVGPRPNVKRETDLYTPMERKLLDVKPGITDFASIVFSDEGDILKDHADPDIAYQQLIRPGKGHLGLFYIDHQSVVLDIQLVILTIVAIVSKSTALGAVQNLLRRHGAPESLITIAGRSEVLVPTPPPGGRRIVTQPDEDVA